MPSNALSSRQVYSQVPNKRGGGSKQGSQKNFRHLINGGQLTGEGRNFRKGFNDYARTKRTKAGCNKA